MFVDNGLYETTIKNNPPDNKILITVLLRLKMRELNDSNNHPKWLNRPIQAVHPVDLGALYQFLRVLQITCHVLFPFNNSVQIHVLQTSRSRPHSSTIRSRLPIVSTVVFHYFLLSFYYYTTVLSHPSPPPPPPPPPPSFSFSSYSFYYYYYWCCCCCC